MKERAQARKDELVAAKHRCEGRGESGPCLLSPIFDGKWCPWHAELVLFGKSAKGGYVDFQAWIEQRLERKDYRWKMHTAGAWWDLVNGRGPAQPPTCDGCGRNLLTLRRGTQPMCDKAGVFCGRDCWAEAVAEKAIA